MATSQVETVTTGADKAKLAVALLLVLAGFVAYFMLAPQGVYAQWGALIVGVLAGVAVFLQSAAGKGLVDFGREAMRELRKVVWPTRKEATQTTMFVFAFALVMSLFLWLTDKTLEWVLYSLVLGWR
ncbi:preprotein translocase subunit SecE [Brachymonas denitrificans]|jgi:preprotein translocase subunit SecE|uniref:Protein translocase subunit SecE n=1 Tax=Brachymonas denitrificans DSM 15123 TaxID=1121117 RepID=A0A1H8GQV9_9BURK|nr:preprotein translocase subunit SecE [Brachymonas denitrificans]SEN46383.1 protein translocase subunit secE/sec61 gamma [Brachymonas denitrificans DSM 15123]